jgi:hypothetical protein
MCMLVFTPYEINYVGIATLTYFRLADVCRHIVAAALPASTSISIDMFA